MRKALDRGCEQWLPYPSDITSTPSPGTGVVGAQEAVHAAMGTGVPGAIRPSDGWEWFRIPLKG
eukprot:6279968-Prorocentrum_lima.AAC.1